MTAKKRVAATLAALRKQAGTILPDAPDFRDTHIYGGLVIAAACGFMSIGWAAPALAGVALFYLGVWRLG